MIFLLPLGPRRITDWRPALTLLRILSDSLAVVLRGRNSCQSSGHNDGLERWSARYCFSCSFVFIQNVCFQFVVRQPSQLTSWLFRKLASIPPQFCELDCGVTQKPSGVRSTTHFSRVIANDIVAAPTTCAIALPPASRVNAKPCQPP